MIFEFQVDHDVPGRTGRYDAASSAMRRLAAQMPGFHGIERFENAGRPGHYVAIAEFDDESAVALWRSHPAHRRIQALGRRELLSWYRLRMCEVVRDYGRDDRAAAPDDSRAVHG